MPRKIKRIDTLSPDDELKGLAMKILKEYPDIQKRLEDLTDDMKKRGYDLQNPVGMGENVEEEYQEQEEEIDFGKMPQLQNEIPITSAAKDLMQMGEMVIAVAIGENLGRNGKLHGNSHLNLLEPLAEGLPPRSAKCIEETGKWYDRTLNYLDKMTHALTKNITDYSMNQRDEIAQQIRELDHTAGLITRINALAEAIIEEMKRNGQYTAKHTIKKGEWLTR